jgi:anti-sigma factor RsiW
MRFACKQCRALLPGYIQRELAPKERERVSRHLNSCAACYVAYTEQRQLVSDLAFAVPRLGGGAPRLDKMRAAIAAEMARPAAHAPRVRLYQARYSLAALILMVALLLPWSMRSRSFALPTPPQPETLTPPGTAVVALPTETFTLTATLQPNYAPATPSATSATGTP